ncbi:hypothetical protein BLNAU_5028 [Blattamonas nauphoetae]|uniref:Uncharacterized protein n=1 Tax=Blattamonas nauphoetae TaxID=2049346 RepID=A0ABQ9Y8S4_9EUKA|nr:hypothetical protein BLNAU_5028 [Blattamonas nauphoetae]
MVTSSTREERARFLNLESSSSIVEGLDALNEKPCNIPQLLDHVVSGQEFLQMPTSLFDSEREIVVVGFGSVRQFKRHSLRDVGEVHSSRKKSSQTKTPMAVE